MFCKKCGRELKDGTKFCDQCGTPQNVEAPKSQEPDQMQVPSESGAPSSNSQNVSHTTTVVQNTKTKKHSYVKFQTYFYDRMGGALETSIAGDDYETLKYTGPLRPGEIDTAYYDWVLSMPSSTAVVYPKTITVTFADDEEITFENDFYATADDFYGGKLKD